MIPIWWLLVSSGQYFCRGQYYLATWLRINSYQILENIVQVSHHVGPCGLCRPDPFRQFLYARGRRGEGRRSIRFACSLSIASLIPYVAHISWRLPRLDLVNLLCTDPFSSLLVPDFSDNHPSLLCSSVPFSSSTCGISTDFNLWGGYYCEKNQVGGWSLHL